MSTSIDTVIQKHLHRIAPEADLDLLKPDDELGPTLDIDSMDFYGMMVGISEELGIDIPEQEYGQLLTLRKIKGFLNKSVRSNGADL